MILCFLKRRIINRSRAKLFVGDLMVKTQTLLWMSITVSFALSLIVTLLSYYIVSPSDPRILDAAWVNRGWPLYWMDESWSYWSLPPYPHHFVFQTVNFLMDFAFYAIVFQVPTQLYLYLKEARKPRVNQTTEKLA
jgi:hypothetical protein